MSIRRERPPERKTGNWQKQFTTLLTELRDQPLDRRTFLRRINLLLAASAFPLCIPAAIKKNTDAHSSRETLEAVHDHLFPLTDDAPGAKQINATAYLLQALSEPQFDPDNREFIRNGVSWLNQLAKDTTGLTFVALDKEKREQVLRQIEKSTAGERWLSLLLLFLFEALLSDPVYGANPDQIGWRWLEHHPGFPLPTPDKTYRTL